MTTTQTTIKPLVLDLLRLAWEDEQRLVATLTEAERTAEGAPDRWAPKDTIAHIAAWRARQITKLAAATRAETLPVWRDMDLINALNHDTFATFQHATWLEVRAESERAYTALLAQVAAMSEDELTQPRETGEPLWPETLGNGLWHVYSHLLSYARERDQMPAAFAMYERLGATLAQLHAPDDMRADAAYNLACLYALAGQRESALASLRQALTLKPRLAAWARNDDDLASLRALPEFDQIAPPRDEAAELIAPDALAALRASPDAPVVVDVRDPEEYAAGHIQGARNIPLSALAARLGELPSEREIITYCNMHHKGASRGEQAADLLRERGYTARAIDGGYPAWQSANLPTESEA